MEAEMEVLDNQVAGMGVLDNQVAELEILYDKPDNYQTEIIIIVY